MSRLPRSILTRRAGWRLAAVVAIGMTTLASLAADDLLDSTRSVLEKWVETRRLISEERLHWQQSRESLRDRTELVQREIDGLRERIEEARKGITEADARRAEVEAENERLKAHSDGLAAAVIVLEERTRQLLTRVPDPIRERVRPLSQRLPEPQAQTMLSLSERFQNVVGILNELNKFHGEITVVTEVRPLPDGSAAEVTAVYLGISYGFYVNAAGTAGGVGRGGENGWEWKPADDVAPRIATAIAVLKNERLAEFVNLPIEVQ